MAPSTVGPYVGMHPMWVTIIKNSTTICRKGRISIKRSRISARNIITQFSLIMNIQNKKEKYTGYKNKVSF